MKFDLYKIGMTDLEHFLEKRILEGRSKVFTHTFERNPASLEMVYSISNEATKLFRLVVTTRSATIYALTKGPRGALRRTGISGEYDLAWQAYLTEVVGRPYSNCLFEC